MTRTVTPRCAARASAPAMRRPAGSSAKRYASSQTSRCASSIAFSSAGKYSAPFLSNTMRLPETKRLMGSMVSATGAALQLEGCGQRGMVRELGQGVGVMDGGSHDAKAASVDAVEPEHRQHGREGSRGTPARD